jgi:serine/threonine protein kinase
MRRSFNAPDRKTPLFRSSSEFTRGRELGSGAFATVFEVVHKSSGVRYAMKQINLAALSSLDQENVEKELEIHVRLKHANVIQLYDFLVEDSSVYLILEYASRGNLFRHMNRKRITENDIRKFFVQTALAIEYLHSQKVIRRDLKPENLLLDSNFNIKLCDLGWAAFLFDTLYCKAKAGTYAYMSPESLQGWTQNEKTDVWSLGILLYELYYNREPYTGQSCQEQLIRIRNTPLKFQDPINFDARVLIMTMLKEKEDERPSLDQIFDSSYLRQYMQENQISRAKQIDGVKSKFMSGGIRSQIGASLAQLVRQLDDSEKPSTNQTSTQKQNYLTYSSNIQNTINYQNNNLVYSSLHLSSHTEKRDSGQHRFMPKFTSIEEITKISNSLPTPSITSSGCQITKVANKPTIFKSHIFEQDTNRNFPPQINRNDFSYLSRTDDFNQISPITPEKPRTILRTMPALTPEVHAKTFHSFTHSTVDISKANINSSQINSSHSPMFISKHKNLQQTEDNVTKSFADMNLNNTSQVLSSKIINLKYVTQESRPSNNDHICSSSVSNFDAKSLANNLYRNARRIDQDSTNENPNNNSVVSNSVNDSRSISPNMNARFNDQPLSFTGPKLKIVPFALNPKHESATPNFREDSMGRKIVMISKHNGILSERHLSVEPTSKTQTNTQFAIASNSTMSQIKPNILSHRALPPNNLSNGYNIYMKPMIPQPSAKIPDDKFGGKGGQLTNIYSQRENQFSETRSASHQITRLRPNIFVNIDLNNRRV